MIGCVDESGVREEEEEDEDEEEESVTWWWWWKRRRRRREFNGEEIRLDEYKVRGRQVLERERERERREISQSEASVCERWKMIET
jgi:hypothetical protein